RDRSAHRPGPDRKFASIQPGRPDSHPDGCRCACCDRAGRNTRAEAVFQRGSSRWRRGAANSTLTPPKSSKVWLTGKDALVGVHGGGVVAGWRSASFREIKHSGVGRDPARGASADGRSDAWAQAAKIGVRRVYRACEAAELQRSYAQYKI